MIVSELPAQRIAGLGREGKNHKRCKVEFHGEAPLR
jgi:hypothetical protein